VPKRKVCTFCKDRAQVIDYKEPGKLLPFVADRGKIAPRRKSGTCARHQRLLAMAIKRARHLALLPHAPGHIREAEEAR
jgi:small subunit ribosomal protein S18